MKALLPLLLGLAGTRLSPDEKALIKARRPAGFLLFARNIESEAQVRALVDELGSACGDYTPVVAVDQEGGRVQRLSFGGKLPAARVFGEWFGKDPSHALEGCMLNALLLAAQLRAVGANLLLGPVLDLGLAETHAVIGERAFAARPETVAELGEAFLRGVAQGGCWGCIKHAPGHGRATADSHFGLPQVDAAREELEQDFLPFKALAGQAEFMMTAHIKYAALDAENPATYSPRLVKMMKQEWGFGGVLLADDIGMQALGGPYVQRAKQALHAGCDLVIAALSVVKHGMAGTVFDAESFAALQQGDLPQMEAGALARLEALKLPEAPGAEALDKARARLKKLWADGPERMGYSLAL
ncbi:MAG: beta-N-acetylhexosaminidase [Proteobacteria bacterium]|nr:beta-N-acetylhexosaminidase [Pseudomonadota bacterium]